ncbi:Peptidase C50, separase [Parasponia andersonii]|uniref:separase n=1 Tax=Parasponia andersonii TaxID=3476 RepID=A0A2P5CGU2_PARAD|nr:Peptidase C50, separase [Parasponia andersonii]
MDDTSIISKLQGSDATGIYSLFSHHLRPFSDLTNLKKTKRSTTTKDQQSLARSLAKGFLSFLSRALSILPKRLAEPSKFGGSGADELAVEFFDVYRLCLDCLDAVSSQLECKPYSIQAQRVRMVHCLDAWGRWKEAEAECWRVLESLKGVNFGAKSAKSEGGLLPCVGKGSDDKELGVLVVEIVVTLVKCASMDRRKSSCEEYRTVPRLVEEARPWFRVLDASMYEKLHRVLVSYLGRCTILIVGELTFTDDDLARVFCFTTISEHAKSLSGDQTYKFARRLCSSLFSLQESRSTFSIDILICVLDSLAHEEKVSLENNGMEFVELVAYCANKCQAKSPNFCYAIGAHLNKITDDFNQVKTPFHLILRLYAEGLLFMDFKLKTREYDLTSSGGVIKSLCDSVDILQNLLCLLCSLRSYFHIGCQKSYASSSVSSKDVACLLCSPCISHNKASMSWTHNDEKAYLLSYLIALKYICLPLAELVNSEKKQMIVEREAAAVSSRLSDIQEVFDQFCDVFFFYKRCKCSYEGEGNGFDESSILGIAVALFIISIRTKLNMKKSVRLLKDVISSEWIQPHGLKYLYVSLYNIGVILYRDKQLKEASKALKISFLASWACVLRLCDLFLQKSEGSSGDFSEDSIINFVNESCAKTAFLLDVLHQCDGHKVKKIVAESLENWSVAANVFNKLPGPMSLVKQWVKIACKSHVHVDVEDAASTLYHTLSSSATVSKRAMGIILEQELLAYEQVDALHPELCQKMQKKIIGYLLEDVCVTSDSWLQRSRILMRKGKVLRFYGMLYLKDCIQCLSEAISLLKLMSSETSSYGIEPCHLLAVAHCQRAFCTQEAEPNSKHVLEDIRMALNLWLSITSPDCFSAEDKCFGVSENMMILLYNINDLLSVKGFLDYHYDTYRLMIRLFQWKSVPLEKFLAVMWECRRIRHTLCISPINEAFLMSLADHNDELTKSIDFWIRCLEGSQPLLVGFQHSFLFLSSNFPRGLLDHESLFHLDITVDEVKEVAFKLISSVPASSSVFVAGYLFYDLSERLISNGQITEALFYAKQGHRLRSKLFEEKFRFSVIQQPEKSNKTMDILQKFTYIPQDLQVCRSVANDFWSFDTISWDMESFYVSPWIVLQCYLESTLQVGIAYETMGNGSEAESLFLWGKSVSCSLNLPQFVVAFSSVLGKLYCKKKLWDMAERELQGAKQYLDDGSSEISCLKCRLILEVTIDQHLGDLSQSITDNSSGKVSIESSSRAETLYKSALDKLNLSDWASSASFPKEARAGSIVLEKALVKSAEYSASSTFAHTEETQQGIMRPSGKGPKDVKEVKKCRQTRNSTRALLKDQDPMPENNFRSTRSNCRSSRNQNISSNIQVGGETDCSRSCGQRDFVLEIKSCKIAFGCENICVSNKIRCWHCLQMEVAKYGLMTNIINMKWEFVRRRLLVKLLTCLGNCLESHGQIHEAHEIFFQSILILVNQDSFHLTSSYVPITLMLNIIRKEISGDLLTVERAEILYHISWLSFKGYHSRDTRINCCDLSHIPLQQLVDWLMQAFVLCQEVPILFQKVSRLLAVMFVLAASGELCSLSSSKVLSENHWASYFHQASLGSHLHCQFFTNDNERYKVQHLVDAEDSCISGSTCLGAEMQNLLRLAPESTQGFEVFVENFFLGLPCTTAICISLLGGPYANLLLEMLHDPLCVRAWMLVSRLDSKSQPIVLLLPMDSILEEVSDDATNSGISNFSKSEDSCTHWQCPWGSTVVDDVAPEFKLILEENFLSTITKSLEDTVENRKLWWTRRKKLDHRLGEFLKKVEDSWLGPWKYLLLGKRSSYKRLDLVQKKLAHYLKSKCKMDVNESLLKVILGIPRDAFEDEKFIAQLCLRKGCHIGQIKCGDKKRCSPSSNDANGLEELSSLALEQICGAVKELEGEGCMDREPIMLILDFEVQMLPWENIPILRNQEVYRMPSVWSISARLHRSYHNQEQVRTLPFIDPLDAFYLLNPDGDLKSTQTEFENWFKDQNLEGRAGHAPTAEELAMALKSHDLFIYFGHGSGAQYIPRHEIQKLENCAATLLMGCSSGSLTLNGCYVPHGTPLSYLLAGSPVIVANLWDVTDKDIDRFGKAMLNAWLKERLGASSSCDKCNLLSEELEALSLRGGKGNAKKISRKKLAEASERDSSTGCCDHKPKIGAFMGQAREACTLPFLIGASPVCYGVPTGIRNKKDL